jgi:hypothetical protein
LGSHCTANFGTYQDEDKISNGFVVKPCITQVSVVFGIYRHVARATTTVNNCTTGFDTSADRRAASTGANVATAGHTRAAVCRDIACKRRAADECHNRSTEKKLPKHYNDSLLVKLLVY